MRALINEYGITVHLQSVDISGGEPIVLTSGILTVGHRYTLVGFITSNSIGHQFGEHGVQIHPYYLVEYGRLSILSVIHQAVKFVDAEIFSFVHFDVVLIGAQHFGTSDFRIGPCAIREMIQEKIFLFYCSAGGDSQPKVCDIALNSDMLHLQKISSIHRSIPFCRIGLRSLYCANSSQSLIITFAFKCVIGNQTIKGVGVFLEF